MASASTKRETPGIEEPQSKRAKSTTSAPAPVPESSGSLRVVLNPADCNLDFNIEDGITGHALCEAGFSYCWSGARANVGISAGKYCFGCKILCNQSVNMEDTPPDQQHVCRIGISRVDEAVGSLGETEHSYGFGGTGKFSNAGKFSNYGETFGVGDTIVCTIDLESKPALLGFSKNGKWLGIAKHFDAGSLGLASSESLFREQQWRSALFPHILLKNVAVKMQFSVEDGLAPEEGYKPWVSAIEDKNAVIGPSLSDPTNCEVLMLVGLPASGKSTWAEKWVKEHPERRYILLGTNLVLDQMKVPGLLRKHNYGERFDRLMDKATEMFNTLLSRASKTPRNYIIDQTNVYKSARKRKLNQFALFHKIAVVVFPKPGELKIRTQKRYKEMGKEVPPEAINEMLANYVLPMSKDMPLSDEFFDQVIFTELDRVEAQRYLDEMKQNSAATSAHNKTVSGNSSCIQMPQSVGHALVTGGSWHGVPIAQHKSGSFPHVPYSCGGSEQSAKFDPYSRAYQGSLNPLGGRDAHHQPYTSYRSPAETLPAYHPSCEARRSAYSYSSEGGLPTHHAVMEPASLPSTVPTSHQQEARLHVSCDDPDILVSFQLPHVTGRKVYSSSSRAGYSTNPADVRPASLPPFMEASLRGTANTDDRTTLYQLHHGSGSHTYSHAIRFPMHPADVRAASLPSSNHAFQQNLYPGVYGSSYRSNPTYIGGSNRGPGAFPPRYY